MDASADTFETALGALAETLVSEQDLDSLLHQIAGLACVAIPRCTRSFSAPLTVSGSSLGALNLYSRTTGPYDDQATSFAALCAAQS